MDARKLVGRHNPWRRTAVRTIHCMAATWRFVEKKVVWCERQLDCLACVVARVLRYLKPFKQRSTPGNCFVWQINKRRHTKGLAEAKAKVKKMLKRWETQPALLEKLY